MFTTVTGIIASIFTGIFLVPQLVKIIREKKAQDMSPLMLLCLFIGVAFWVLYGILKKDTIIIVSNSFSLLVNAAIAVLTVKYRK